jgi:hypothetical protein
MTLVKRILSTLLQFFAFGALLVVGAFWAMVRMFAPFLAVIPVWRLHIAANRDFVANGLVFALVLFAILLVVSVLRKGFKTWGKFTVLAFVCAVALSFIIELGFITPSQ